MASLFGTSNVHNIGGADVEAGNTCHCSLDQLRQHRPKQAAIRKFHIDDE